jgi:hypothetical protein
VASAELGAEMRGAGVAAQPSWVQELRWRGRQAVLSQLPAATLYNPLYSTAVGFGFLDPKCAQKTRGGLIFAKKRRLVAANRRLCRPFLSAIV